MSATTSAIFKLPARRVLHRLRRWYLQSALKYQSQTGLKVSFSQSGEDLIIQSIFRLLGIQQPTYMDVGAFHPYNLSNTALLHFNGSKGINIEPNPALIASFRNERPTDINLNIGIADVQGELDYYVMSAPSLNTFSKESAEAYTQEGARIISKTTVPVLTLETVVNTYCDGKSPDFLSLDIEGMELSILKGTDFTRFMPKVICLETLTYSSRGRGVKDNDSVGLLTSVGYFVYADTFVNTILVRQDIYH